MAWVQCPDNTCIFSVQPLYSQKSFMVLHIRNKPMKKIIDLAIKLKVCESPQTENYETLAQLIADRSEVDMEE